MVFSVALIVLVIVGVKGLAWIKDPMKRHVAGFDLKTDVGGLRVGDEVRIGGFKVGEISRIIVRTKDEDPNRPPHIAVIFTMPARYKVRQNAEVRIGGTLTGTSWLNFETLGSGEELKEGEPLLGLPSTMSETIARISAMAPELQQTIADVRGKTIPSLNKTIENFGESGKGAGELIARVKASYPDLQKEYTAVTQKAVAMMDSIRALIGDTTDDFRTTVANLRKTTASISDKTPGIVEKVDGALSKVNTAMDSVNKTLAEVNATVVNARELTASAKTVIAGNQSKLDGIVDSVKKASDNLKAATAEIRRSPWRLLYKPSAEEVGNLNVYDSARQFAEGANDLNDAAAALRDAIKDKARSPEEIRGLLQEVESRFQKFRKVEEKLYSDVK